MTLQLIHMENAPRRASSLYCVWILVPGKSGTHLRAVWMDREMKEFARQFAPALATAGELSESAVDEPGGSQKRSEFVLAIICLNSQ